MRRLWRDLVSGPRHRSGDSGDVQVSPPSHNTHLQGTCLLWLFIPALLPATGPKNPQETPLSMTTSMRARGQRPMAVKRGWCGSARRSARAHGPKPIPSPRVTKGKYNRKNKSPHVAWCAKQRAEFKAREERRMLRHIVATTRGKVDSLGTRFIRYESVEVLNRPGLHVPADWRGTGSPSMVVYLQRRAVEESGIVRSVSGFTTFVQRLCTGLCTNCGNHVSYGLFSCANFMELARRRLRDDVLSYLVVLAETNRDDQEVLEYVRSRIAAAYEADCVIEEDLRSYWWSVVFAALFPLFPGEFRGGVKFLEFGYDLSRLVVVTAGAPLPAKTSRRRVMRSWSAVERSPLDMLRWILEIIGMEWEEVDGLRLPLISDPFRRAVRLASILYGYRFSDMVYAFLFATCQVAGGVHECCFRRGLWFVEVPEGTDSLSWGDWSRSESYRSRTLYHWLREAMRAGSSEIALDRKILAVARHLTGVRDLVFGRVFWGPSRPPGNIGEAMFAARRPCRDRVAVVPSWYQVSLGEDQNVVLVSAAALSPWVPGSGRGESYSTPSGISGSLPVPLGIEQFQKDIAYIEAIISFARSLQEYVPSYIVQPWTNRPFTFTKTQKIVEGYRLTVNREWDALRAGDLRLFIDLHEHNRCELVRRGSDRVAEWSRAEVDRVTKLYRDLVNASQDWPFRGQF